jgi:hypothetical protein
MTRSLLWVLVAVAASPAIAYLTYWLAKELGFLDPPRDAQHGYRRAIVLSLYCFLLFLPVFLYGFEKGWPRAWVVFGIINSLALVVFGTVGVWSVARLWKIRHPEPPEPSPTEVPEADRLANLSAEPRRDSEELL